MRQVAQRLHIVDHRRAAIETDGRRKGWFQARLSALAFERLQERRLLATDIRAGPNKRDDVQVHTSAKQVLTQGARCIRLIDGFLYASGPEGHLTTDIDEGRTHA